MPSLLGSTVRLVYGAAPLSKARDRSWRDGSGGSGSAPAAIRKPLYTHLCGRSSQSDDGTAQYASGSSLHTHCGGSSHSGEESSNRGATHSLSSGVRC